MSNQPNGCSGIQHSEVLQTYRRVDRGANQMSNCAVHDCCVPQVQCASFRTRNISISEFARTKPVELSKLLEAIVNMPYDALRIME